MRPTHKIIIYEDHICVLGNENYFSWIIEHICGEWDLSTIYGRIQGSFKTFREALEKTGYQEDRYARTSQ